MAFGNTGWRLLPERAYLLDSENFSEFLAKYREADTILDELETINIELRDAHKKTQQLRNRLHKARKVARGEDSGSGMRDDMFKTGRQERGRQMAEKIRLEHNEHLEKVEQLEEEHEQLARHIDKNFVAYPVDPSVPNTSAPDKARIYEEVGRPVELVP